VERLLGDEVIGRKTTFVLTGGEFLLHPECERILWLLSGQPVILASNAILTDRLIRLVREFGVRWLTLSLDGKPETQARVRGVDNYDSVVRVVDTLRDKAHITINYTISPWNTHADLEHVVGFCRDKGVRFTAGYYSDVEFFGASGAGLLYRADDIVQDPYLTLYPAWQAGELRLPCYSVRQRCVIRPNSDVDLCSQKRIGLGNLYERELGQIWNSAETIAVKTGHVGCNACWLQCQRSLDIATATVLSSTMPAAPLGRLFGTYSWKELSGLRDYARAWVQGY
jgi:MoaA/NifB/PqqE/SkfB family radical SAM enzyme